jgi:hypothetical protein
MPRPPAPCGTMSAYRRHKRKGEEVDGPCHQAMVAESRERSGRADGAFTASTGASVDARERLIANMQLVERAMEAIADVDPIKIVQLSTRHSELVAQLVAVSGGGEGPAKETDPFDFLGDASRRTAPAPRK